MALTKVLSVGPDGRAQAAPYSSAFSPSQYLKSLRTRPCFHVHTHWLVFLVYAVFSVLVAFQSYGSLVPASCPAQVEETFAKCCASVPTDALRRHLLAMAPSPEAFLTCRGGFARSLAALNACSYVLGIGDRHLENFLLDTTTG